MNIDPKIGAWCNFLALVLSLIGAGTVQLVGVSDVVAGEIKTVALDGVAIMSAANLVFHLYSAPAAGPLAK
jgi:hypothetical protein